MYFNFVALLVRKNNNILVVSIEYVIGCIIRVGTGAFLFVLASLWSHVVVLLLCEVRNEHTIRIIKTQRMLGSHVFLYSSVGESGLPISFLIH